MKTNTLLSTLLATACATSPFPASAQAQSRQPMAGEWRYGLSIYGYFPSVGGSSKFPQNRPDGGGGGTTIDVDADNVIDKIEGAFMGSFDAHNGRWGVFTDVMYLSMGDERQNTRDFSIGGVLPGSTSANLAWDLRGTIWTLAGQYRIHSTPGTTVDALGGARMFKLKQSLRYDISGELGPLPPLARSGSLEHSETNWDAIVGLKGRTALGSSQRWSLPFYLDIGGGDSKLTWQAAGGISYGYSWGELTAMWRFLGYEFKSGRVMQDVNFSGPMVGATFRF